jgi:hypothetical protein
MSAQTKIKISAIIGTNTPITRDVKAYRGTGA